MRITLTLDDELIKKVQLLTGLKRKSLVVREALRAFIERESARSLARIGGSQPTLGRTPRRRSKSNASGRKRDMD